MKQADITLVQQKHRQLDSLLPTMDAEAWLVLTREHSDLSTLLFTGIGLVGEAAFLFTRDGARHAIVADYAVEPIAASGEFQVISYGQGGFLQPLTELLAKVGPQSLALNFSESDPLVDGLTLGMLRKLRKAWPVADLDDRISSSAGILGTLRSQKTDEEVRRIREAIRTTELVLDELGRHLKPGMTEIEATEFVKARQRHYGVSHSFGDGANIMAGHAGIGHRPASEARVTEGDVVVVDMGIYYEGYTSDIQRTWYVRRPGETAPAPEIQHRFEAGRDAMKAAIAAMKPGVMAHELDRIARDVLSSRGVTPYTHALGHQIGRSVHDGGTTLAPLNARYGDRGNHPIQAGEVYTVEPVVPGRTGVDGSPIGVEQDVLVTAEGVEILSTMPETMPLI
jgi:Xaa-Pro aminopeptidase